jgi:DUF1680 family protein
MKLKLIPVAFVCLFFACSETKNATETVLAEYPIQGVPFNKVEVNDNFWLPKIETNREATIPASFRKCEEMGRLENFLIAGGKMEGQVRGEMPFDDTDVYKIIEGASYSMTTFPDSKLDAYVDSLIEIIAVGQEEDGYLTTWKTIDPTHSPAHWCAPGERWENLVCSHELYNSGHMFEAATAHFLATGKTSFLDIATKNADLLLSVFGPEKNPQVPGHQIVETGLIKLYLVTDKQEYLDLAKHFLDARGDSTKREIWGPYNQDHKPVVHQEETVGHAVRALYMYAGMTDIAALFKDAEYAAAVDKIWDNVVNKKIYITGGLGAKHEGEAFGENYELPNLTSYNETCAAIANVYWNYRMFLLHGDSKYIDVLERSLYNGVISGISLDGTGFFYPNPMSCDMHYHFNRGHLDRQPWFDCSCCPSNLCRFMPSVPGYIYALNNDNLYVNLFVQSKTEVEINSETVAISQETNYPWEGTVLLEVSPRRKAEFTMHVRIPGWAKNQPLPGDLYRYTEDLGQQWKLSVNGIETDFTVEKGYALITREWKQGDNIKLELPMDVKTVFTSELVETNLNKIALERGPIVYCVEEKDNPEFDNIAVSNETRFTSLFRQDLLKGIEIIQAGGTSKAESFTAVPYFVWNNRGANKMDVWLTRK